MLNVDQRELIRRMVLIEGLSQREVGRGFLHSLRQAVGRGALMLCDATQSRKFDLRPTKVSHAKVTQAEVIERNEWIEEELVS